MLDTSLDFKEQLIETRRSQILRGAAQVFAEKGFHKALTTEIARAAGVSVGTIYHYFDNKRELLLAMMELIAPQSLKSSVLDHPPEDPKEFLKMLIRDRYHLAQECGFLIAPIMAEIFADADLRQEVYHRIAMPIASHVEQSVQAHIDSGCFRQVDPMIVTYALIGAILLNFAFNLSDVDGKYESLSADGMIEPLVSLFLGVYCPQMNRND